MKNSLLVPPEIVDAINDINCVFTWAESHPDDLAERLPGYEVPPDYSPEQRRKLQTAIEKLMLAAVRDDVICVWLASDVSYADDGTGPEYLFAFLHLAADTSGGESERRSRGPHSRLADVANELDLTPTLDNPLAGAFMPASSEKDIAAPLEKDAPHGERPGSEELMRALAVGPVTV